MKKVWFVSVIALVLSVGGCGILRDVIVFTEPVITLEGEEYLLWELGDEFIDPGATALDDNDGDITGDIVVGGDTVDTDTCGVYVITYNVENSGGLSADEVTRTVEVVTQYENWEGVSIDDFTDGSLGYFYSSNLDNWEILEYDGGSVIQRGGDLATGSGGGSFVWNYDENIRIQFKLKVVQRNEAWHHPWMRLREDSGTNSEYRLEMRSSELRLRRRNDYGSFVTLATSDNGLDIEKWYDIEVITYGTQFWIFKNGDLVISYNDTSEDAIVGNGTYRYRWEGHNSWEYYDYMLFACVSEMPEITE